MGLWILSIVFASYLLAFRNSSIIFKRKYIGFFDNQKDQRDRLAEERVLLEHMDDIYKHADRLKATVMQYEAKPTTSKAAANGVGS